MTVYLVLWSLARTGGMERHVTEAAVALAQEGTKVVVFTQLPFAPRNSYVRQLRAAGVRVVAPGWISGVGDLLGRLPWGRLRCVLQRLMGIVHRVQRTVEGRTWSSDEEALLSENGFHPLTRKLMLSLAKAAGEAKPDVVHLHGCRFGQHWVAAWADLQGFSCLYTEHTTMSDWGGPCDRGGPEVVDRAADVLCAVSGSVRASMVAELPFPREIIVSRHIVEDLALLPSRAENRIAILLCVARLARHKGIDILIEAASRMRLAGIAFELQFAGDGEDRREFESLASRLSLREQVSFLGNVKYSRIGQLWEAADIGVLPSRTEGLPLSILEAQSHGKPVVASRIGGIPEVIRHGENGLLVMPGDPGALAEALMQLIVDRSLRKRLGTSARQSFEQGGWSGKAVTEDMLLLYGNAAQTRAEFQEARAQFGAWVNSGSPATPAASMDRSGLTVFLGDDEHFPFTSKHRDCHAVLLSQRYSGFRTALIQAMSLGTPIVLCGQTDTLPLIHRVNGIVARLDHPAGIDAALRELLNDPLFAQRLGHAASRTLRSSMRTDSETNTRHVHVRRVES